MLFRGFDYFVQSLIAYLLMLVPAMIIIIPAYAIFFASMFAVMPQPGAGPAAKPNPNAIWAMFGTMALVGLFVFAVGIAIQVFFYFTYLLIVDRKLTGVQAITTSFRAACANFVGILLLILLTALLTMVGLLACYVGMFFVLPVNFAAVAVAYRKVFPDLTESEQLPDEPEADDRAEPEADNY